MLASRTWIIELAPYLALLYQKLDRTEEARAVWLSLIESNPESYEHYQGYLSLNGLNICKDCF